MKKPVLVVDDPAGALRELGEHLSIAGYDVARLQMDAALDGMNDKPPEIILVQLFAGGGSGVTLAEQVRQRPDGAIVPIIFVGTGHEMVTSVSDALAVGGDYYFQHPLDLPKVIAKIRTYIGVGEVATMDEEKTHPGSTMPGFVAVAPRGDEKLEELDFFSDTTTPQGVGAAAPLDDMAAIDQAEEEAKRRWVEEELRRQAEAEARLAEARASGGSSLSEDIAQTAAELGVTNEPAAAEIALESQAETERKRERERELERKRHQEEAALREQAEEELRRVEARRRADEERKSADRARKAGEEEELRRRIEAETKARIEGETKARIEAETKARIEAETKARIDAETKARIDAEAKARIDAETKARIDAESKARIEAETKARIEAETKARIEAETKARIEAETKARIEAETKARIEAETKARIEAEARREAERRAEAELRRREEEEEERRREQERDEEEDRERRDEEERKRREDDKRREEEDRKRREEDKRREEEERKRREEDKRRDEERRREDEERKRREEERRREDEKREAKRREEEERRRRVADEEAEILRRQREVEAVEDEKRRQSEMQEIIERTVRERLEGEVQKSLQRSVRSGEASDDLSPPEPRAPSTESGDIDEAHDDVAAIFARLCNERVTGKVRFSKGEVEKLVGFENGRPVEIVSSDPLDRLEEFLLREHLLTRQQYQKCRLKQITNPRQMGAFVVAEGFVKAAELFEVVRRHFEDTLHTVFEWESGRYFYSSSVVSVEDRIVLQTSPERLVADGVRRRYLLARLLKRLGGPASLLVAKSDLAARVPALGFEPKERQLTRLIDGAHSIEDLVFTSGLSEERVYQVLYVLVAFDLAEVAVRGLEGPSGEDEHSAAIDRARIREKHEQAKKADYFDFLGLQMTATEFDIQRAIEAVRRVFGKDRFGHEVATELKEELEEIDRVLADAEYVLRDPRLRDAYIRHMQRARAS